MQQTFQFTPNLQMLFNFSHVIKTLALIVYVQFSLSYVSHAPFCSDLGLKIVAPLLHCSINDTLINRIPH